MITAKFLKLRKAQEQSYKLVDNAQRVKDEAQLAYHKVHEAWMKDRTAYLDEGERCGYCRSCLANGIMKPQSECKEVHILLAGVA